MLDDILFALWFFLPAGVANMAPVPIAKLPGLRRLNMPIDFGATFHGKRVFGENKTWRGLVAGVIAATLALWLQQYLAGEIEWVRSLMEQIDYQGLPTLIVGPLLAIGALGGDAIKSFFKRRRGAAPGQAWFPYDLIDHIIGAAIVMTPFVVFELWVYLVVVLVWLVANLMVSYAGYLLHIKERPI
jgi:CDP-2,3-bis-(O-geranylgeranyl)-sn-glycerol synthase